jgi:hypothetical protein
MQANSRIERPQPARPAPEVIQVPPPEGDPSLFGGILFGSGLMLLGAGLMLTGAGVGGSWIDFTWATIVLGYAIVLVVYAHRRRRRYRVGRDAVLAQVRERGPSGAAQSLESQWKKPREPPDDDAVARTLAQGPPPASGRVVVLTPTCVPHVGYLSFEAEIVAPTQLFSGWWQASVGATAVGALFLANYLGLLPSRIGSASSAFNALATMLVIGFVAGAVWAWFAVLRPKYVRLAPGMIQIMRFGIGRSRPAIRSYPMDAGTLAILRGEGSRLTLTLLREGRRDTIPISQMRHRQRVLERVWQALLSTAPTPPLSEEELIG